MRVHCRQIWAYRMRSFRWLRWPIPRRTRLDAMQSSRHCWYAVASSSVGRRTSSSTYSAYSATMLTSEVGCTTSPWSWCSPTAVSTLSTTTSLLHRIFFSLSLSVSLTHTLPSRCINPFIYAAKYREFQQGVRRLIAQLKKNQQQSRDAVVVWNESRRQLCFVSHSSESLICGFDDTIWAVRACFISEVLGKRI